MSTVVPLPPIPKQFGRFVTTPAHILLAMGVVPTEADVMLLDSYKTWAGFPKIGKQGYSAEALFKWAVKNAETIAYRKKIGKMIQQGTDNTAADFKIIDQHASKATFGVDGNEFPESISGLDRLGALIQRRFTGLTVEVSRQLITKWKKLQCVQQQPGLVPFPAPTNANRYNVKQVFDWVEKWIVKGQTEESSGQASFGASADLERQIKEVNLRRAQRLEAQELGEIIPFNDAEAYIAGIAEQISRYYDRLIEGDNGLRKVIGDALVELGLEQQTRSVVDQRILERLAKCNDDLKSEFELAKAYALKELDGVRNTK